MANEYSTKQVLEAIKITSEVCGSEISDGAAKAMLLHLKPYGSQAVMNALTACQAEVKGRLALADILHRLESEDGRPGAEEAWGMIAHALTDESETIIWTNEMCSASHSATELLRMGDKVGARMAFREAYENLVRQQRLAKAPVLWTVSPGTDQQKRTDALMLAVKAGRLAANAVAPMLPYDATQERHTLLTGQAMSLEEKQTAKAALAKISGMLTVKTIKGEL